MPSTAHEWLVVIGLTALIGTGIYAAYRHWAQEWNGKTKAEQKRDWEDSQW